MTKKNEPLKAGDTVWVQQHNDGRPGRDVPVCKVGTKYIHLGPHPEVWKIPRELPYFRDGSMYFRSKAEAQNYFRRSAAWKIIKTLVAQRPMPEISVDEMAGIARRLGHGDVWGQVMGAPNEGDGD